MPTTAGQPTKTYHVSFRDETGTLRQAVLRDIHPLVWAVHGWVASGHGPRDASVVSWTEVEPGDVAAADLVVRHACGERGLAAFSLAGLIQMAEYRVPRARNAGLESCLSLALQGLRAYARDAGHRAEAVAA